MGHATRSDDLEQCIEECTNCHQVCLDAAAQCLRMGGPHSEPGHITLLLDCAQICQTSADFMLRGSELHARSCAVCAEVCERCADDCARFEDEMMQSCADACRTCADMCREMAGAEAA
jgi:hypothetical protein